MGDPSSSSITSFPYDRRRYYESIKQCNKYVDGLNMELIILIVFNPRPVSIACISIHLRYPGGRAEADVAW